MDIPFRKRNLKRKLRDAMMRVSFGEAKVKRKLPGIRYSLRLLFLRMRRGARAVKYAAEDAAFFVKRLTGHTESLMFAALVVLAGAMLVGSRAGSFLESLVAFLLLVLIILLYGQMKMQRRMLARYVPMIEFVRVRECRLYSDRLRAVNIFAVNDNLDKVRRVRNVRIKYDVVNDSFCPVSIEGVGLVMKLSKDGKTGKVTLPPAVSVLDVAPRKTGSTTVEFRLRDAVPFDAIEWLEVELRGNCRKKERVKPHLYVNAMLHGRVPRLVFEPLEAFLKRPELKPDGGTTESK